MSDYVHKKAIRYRLPRNKANELLEADYLDKNLPKQYGLDNRFEFDAGVDYETGSSSIYLDKVGLYTYGEEGSAWGTSRNLTEEEISHHLKDFQVYDPDITGEELRAVDYCYYNGADAPDIFDVTSDAEEWLF